MESVGQVCSQLHEVTMQLWYRLAVAVSGEVGGCGGQKQRRQAQAKRT